MARDFYHEAVRTAIERDGWRVTHDPYSITIDDVDFEIDLGAEDLIGAERRGEKIAIEIKSFVGPSTVNEFHRAVGQFNDYLVALEEKDPERVLYLAIPLVIYKTFFQKPIIQKSLLRIGARLIVYNPKLKTIEKWIK